MPYCVACGHENQDNFRYCAACGQQLQNVTTQPIEPTHARPYKANALRTTTMVIGLIMAVLLLIGGCGGFVTGSFFDAAEEAFEVEFDDPDDTASSTEDVTSAGGLAILVSFFLFLGAGLARVTTKISLILLIATLAMLIGLVAIDTTSLFAAIYYLAILMVGTSIVLMSIVYWRRRRA